MCVDTNGNKYEYWTFIVWTTNTINRCKRQCNNEITLQNSSDLCILTTLELLSSNNKQPIYNWVKTDLGTDSGPYLVYSKLSQCQTIVFLSTRCNIYISHLCHDASSLSVTEVHWCIIANLGFKFWSKFTAHAPAYAGALWSQCMPRRGEGSSRAMLATASLSC